MKRTATDSGTDKGPFNKIYIFIVEKWYFHK